MNDADDMLAAMEKALRTVVDDPTPDEIATAYQCLVANTSMVGAAVFRDEVVTLRKKEYMRNYMQTRRAALLREKDAKREASA